MSLRLLDLCAGELGVSSVFAARGWECVAIDLVPPRMRPIPARVEFWEADVLSLYSRTEGNVSMKRETCVWTETFDFAWASTPCEKFSVHGLKMWHKNPPYPAAGIELFNHARALLEKMRVPYVMENVRCAEQFVGPAVAHCGPFYLWGNAVPPLLIQGITKGSMLWSDRYRNMKKSQRKREVAKIPSELAACVAEYAERLIEQRAGPEMSLRGAR